MKLIDTWEGSESNNHNQQRCKGEIHSGFVVVYCVLFFKKKGHVFILINKGRPPNPSNLALILF